VHSISRPFWGRGVGSSILASLSEAGGNDLRQTASKPLPPCSPIRAGRHLECTLLLTMQEVGQPPGIFTSLINHELQPYGSGREAAPSPGLASGFQIESSGSRLPESRPGWATSWLTQFHDLHDPGTRKLSPARYPCRSPSWASIQACESWRETQRLWRPQRCSSPPQLPWLGANGMSRAPRRVRRLPAIASATTRTRSGSAPGCASCPSTSRAGGPPRATSAPCALPGSRLTPPIPRSATVPSAPTRPLPR
jgi:hypothetical protein